MKWPVLFLLPSLAMANPFPNWVPDATFLMKQNFIHSTAYIRQLFYYSVEVKESEECSLLKLSKSEKSYELRFCLFHKREGAVLDEQLRIEYNTQVVYSLNLVREAESEDIPLWSIEDARKLRLPSIENVLRYEISLMPMQLLISYVKKGDRADVKYQYPFQDYNLYFSDYYKGTTETRYYAITCRNCSDAPSVMIESKPSRFEGIGYEYKYRMSSVPGQVAPSAVTSYFSQAVTGAVGLVSADIIEKVKAFGLPAL